MALPLVNSLEDPEYSTRRYRGIENIQSVSLATRLVAPFNEHLAPFFETVTTLTWWVSGGKLEFVPLGFTLASYIPFLGCLGILWLLVRHEFDSPAAA